MKAEIPSGFAEAVYTYLTRIPKGRVVTYGQIAAALGSPRAARAVGNILHNNPHPELYPCFRVVDRNGMLAPNFGAPGGIETQRERLEADGIEVLPCVRPDGKPGYRVPLDRTLWKESPAENA